MRLSTIEVLRTINDGGAIEDLNQQIEAATAAVSDRGGTAKVKLELTITRNGDRQVHVVDAVSSTLPKKKNPVTRIICSSSRRESPPSRVTKKLIEQAFVDICMEIGATLPGYIPYRCP